MTTNGLVYIALNGENNRVHFSNQQAAEEFLSKERIIVGWHTEPLFDSYDEWKAHNRESTREIALNKLTEREKEALGIEP